MAQGVFYSLTIDGVELAFKTITYDERPTTINLAQRLLPDGSPNTGFNRNAGDLRQLFATCEELIDDDPDSGNLTDLANYDAGTTYDDSAYALAYGGVVIYSGIGLLVTEISGRGSIPGDGTFRISFESTGAYQKFGEDLDPVSPSIYT